MINKNISEFKVDYYYKFVETKGNCETKFNAVDKMDFILEDKWFRCVKSIRKVSALFEGGTTIEENDIYLSYNIF